ncbi:MAG TPA: DUF6263 family protein [Prolixibacteraceae bacterium]|nr:DUF6263 family protein [Prolixibacteraceae bacterium]
MKTKWIAVTIILLSFSLQMTQAQSKVLLRLNLDKGANYQMTMVMDNDIDQDVMGQKMKIIQKMEMVSSYKVLDVLPDKNYVVEYSFGKMKITMDVNGQQTVMDTENVGDNPAAQSMKDMTAFNLKVTLNNQGKVQQVEGIEEFASKMAGNQQMAQTMHMFSDKNSFETFFEQSFGFFPETEVGVGSTWSNSVKMPAYMNMDLMMNYEVAEIGEEQVVLKLLSNINTDGPIETNGMKMHLKMTGTQNGVMNIDRKSGLEGTSDLTQETDMLMKMKNPESGEEMEFPMKMNSVIKATVVKI